MSTRRYFFWFLSALIMISAIVNMTAQEKISWLEEYSREMEIGKDSYYYEFSTADGNECKVEIREYVTDNKGSVDKRSWVFYLSDIDPDALSFNSRGRAIELTMKTTNSQKFITVYEEGEFDANTAEIELKMNEVDMARSFIEKIREQIPACAAAEHSWADNEDALSWLEQSIGEVTDDDVRWEQRFARGDKPHLANLTSKSTNAKGEEDTHEYRFDLSDIDPDAIKLVVSGKSRSIRVPVRDGKRFMEVTQSGEKEFTDELHIRMEDVDVARETVKALAFLVSGTVPERASWESYSDALEFVKEQIGQVQIGEDLFGNSLSFEDDPAGIVNLTIQETDGDGEVEELTHSFYLADMKDALILQVSRTRITVELETQEGKRYIRNTKGESVSGYDSDVQFYVADIDKARDLIHAFEYAIGQSVEDIQAFASVDEVNSWMEQNFITLYREGETYEQQLTVDEEMANQINFHLKRTKEEEVTENLYQVYPEDIQADDLDIDVSMGRLNVTLGTGRLRYIKEIENGQAEDFRNRVDVYFYDPLTAKNFIVAIRFLKEQVEGGESEEMEGEDALTFLRGNIQNLNMGGEKIEQRLELRDDDRCKLKFTRVETDDDDSEEYSYEFAASDIHKGSSNLSVDGRLIEISLKTEGGKKLIKPYENGEVEDFEDEFSIYADDILLAKRILTAFSALSESCK